MTHLYGTWASYTGDGALVLAAILFVAAGACAVLGIRTHRPVRVKRPGRAVSVFLVAIWLLALVSWGIGIYGYVIIMRQHYGPLTAPPSPIAPITALSELVAFVAIIYFTRGRGLRTAAGSAIVGAIAGPMMFELPFDLIVMGKLYPPPPEPAAVVTLLFFMPLILLEVSSFSLLTLSPAMKLSRYTLFSLGGMFLVFAIWACFGFSYPSNPLSFALNSVSKVLSIVAAVTLFLPRSKTWEEIRTRRAEE